jgi:hypothetical protein
MGKIRTFTSQKINTMADFFYQEPFPILRDNTEYKKISTDYVKVENTVTEKYCMLIQRHWN